RHVHESLLAPRLLAVVDGGESARHGAVDRGADRGRVVLAVLAGRRVEKRGDAEHQTTAWLPVERALLGLKVLMTGVAGVAGFAGVVTLRLTPGTAVGLRTVFA